MLNGGLCKFTQIGHVCLDSAETGQYRPDSAGNRANLARVRPTLTEIGSESAKFGSSATRHRPISDGFRINFGRPVRRNDDYLGTPSEQRSARLVGAGSVDRNSFSVYLHDIRSSRASSNWPMSKRVPRFSPRPLQRSAGFPDRHDIGEFEEASILHLVDLSSAPVGGVLGCSWRMR